MAPIGPPLYPPLTVIKAIRDLQENQNGMVATVKQLQDNLTTTFKPTTMAIVEGLSAIEDGHMP